jgi:hypothetical protein
MIALPSLARYSGWPISSKAISALGRKGDASVRGPSNTQGDRSNCFSSSSLMQESGIPAERLRAFFLCASNMRDVTHDAQHHRLPLHFGSAGPDIAPDPDLLECARTWR